MKIPQDLQFDNAADAYEAAAGDEPANFWKEWHPSHKAAAEAECARLNAEYRKEVEKCL